MPSAPEEYKSSTMEAEKPAKKQKLGVVSGVTIPVFLNVFSILVFLRFGSILGRIGLLGILGKWLTLSAMPLLSFLPDRRLQASLLFPTLSTW